MQIFINLNMVSKLLHFYFLVQRKNVQIIKYILFFNNCIIFVECQFWFVFVIPYSFSLSFFFDTISLIITLNSPDL